MAAEIVGGALLSAFLDVAFDKLASPKFVDFFHGRKLDEKLLDNLNIMLHSINSLTQDAVFDVEDLLGEIDYELTRCQVEAESEPQTFTYKQKGALGLKESTYYDDRSGSKVSQKLP
ncbi:hypothetical protein V8G54_011911 [Vigna mungo]|uniref:Rx N-terminal domain-containing protein n=1 Tax=Vigna mungo TaxID=3915 RepID=A0AAQ3NR33_VIGMU